MPRPRRAPRSNRPATGAPARPPRGAKAAPGRPARAGAAAQPPQSRSRAFTGDAARDAVVHHLAALAGRFPDLPLTPLELPPALDARDAALAHAINDAVLLRWLTLDHLLAQHIDGDAAAIEAPLRAAMLAGAAQILLLDRVPAYAAINHAVQWCKVNIRPGAGALANAVLRRLADSVVPDAPPEPWAGGLDQLPLSSGAARRLRKPVFPDDPRGLLGLALSLPRPLLDPWAQRFRKRMELAQRAAHTIADAPVILNTLHASEATRALPELTPHRVEGCHALSAPRGRLAQILAADPNVWVQDPASAQVVRRLASAGRAPALAVDLCAGLGTKTRQLAAHFPAGQVLATDADPRRLESLRRTFQDHPRVRVLPIEQLVEAARASADLVLVDAPCSNTGVLPRRPEAKYRFNARSLAELVQLQRAICDQAASLLSDRPGARLAYSTCSVEPAENTDQVPWLERHTGLRVTDGVLVEPAGGPAPARSADGPAPSTPDPAQYNDGAFLAVLSRP
ncbi:MAG: hypothetical protein C0475_07205 [Planctomyces sp.]|nr:hypothetical protein [Planctomyces sp.]MBA4039448.1 hypothetical protein [Planctomyces sp.]